MEIRRWCELRGALVYDLEQNRPTRQTPGVSDLIVLWPDGGGCWFVEVKAARGRQSEAQQEFQRAVIAAGGVYVLARGVGDLERRMEAA